MKDDVTLINEVMDKIPNKYMAMMVAAKRAKALNQGVRPLVKADVQKPTTLALYEIAAGVIEPGFDKSAKDILIIEADSSESVPAPEILIDDIDEIDDDVEIEANGMIDDDIEDEIDSEDDEYNDDLDIDISDEDIDLDIYDDEDINEDEDI